MFKGSGRQTPSGKTAAIVQAVMGTAILLVGVWLLLQNWQLTRNTVETSGTVVGFEENTVRGRRGVPVVVYQPVIEFVTADGRQVTFTDPMGTDPPRYQIGAAVQVIYDPANPTTARDKSAGGMWMVPLLLAGVGAVFAARGVVQLLRLHDARSSQSPPSPLTYQH